MNQKQIQRVFDLALEKWKSRNFSAYAPEHQLLLSSILAFCDVHYQLTGQQIPFKLEELPIYRSVDED